LYGCGYGVLGTVWSIESGLIAFGSELFIAPTVVGINLSVGQVVIGTITTTYLTATNADPVVFSDATSNNVHEIRQIVWSAGTSGTGDFDLDDCVLWGRWVDVAFNSSYISSQAGTLTLPGGAGDFLVKWKQTGRTMLIDFDLQSMTLASANAN
jgi:hypothetical protein